MNPMKMGMLLGLIAAMLTVASIVISLPGFGQPAYTPDSIYYMFVSRAIASGHGLKIFNFDLYDPHFYPFTTWAPLYPILLASGIPPLFIQAMLLACITGITFYLFYDSLQIHWSLAYVAATIIATPWPMLMDASYVWSELFAIFWIFVAILFLTQLSHSNICKEKRPVLIHWFFAVLALSLAIYTRYAMVAFLPGLMLSIQCSRLSKRFRWTLTFATPILSGLLILPLLLHNLLASHHLSGAVRPASNTAYAKLISFVGIYIGWIFGDQIWELITIGVCLPALTISVIAYTKKRRIRKTRDEKTDDKSRWMGWISIIFAISYILGIILMRSWKHFDFSTRMLSPIAPLLLLAIIVWSVVIWKDITLKWQRLLMITPFVVLVCLSISTSLQIGREASSNWRNTKDPQWHRSPGLFYTNLYPLDYPKLQGIIVSIKPEIFAFRTGWDFRRIPEGPWSVKQIKAIATTARALLINGDISINLAHELQRIVPNTKLIKIKGLQLLFWEPVVFEKIK
jgi:hypothetical protein